MIAQHDRASKHQTIIAALKMPEPTVLISIITGMRFGRTEIK